MITHQTPYLCPQKLQTKLIIGFWSAGELIATAVLILLMLFTHQYSFFVAITAALLVLTFRINSDSKSVWEMFLQHFRYNFNIQIFRQLSPEQKKLKRSLKKSLPIQKIINFKLEDDCVFSDDHYVFFYRFFAPNKDLLTDAEIAEQIEQLGRLFDTLSRSFSLFGTDKLENMSEIKQFYSSLPVRYEYITSEIVDGIERSDVESNAVQRAYYIICRSTSREDDIYNILLNRGFHVERVQKPEIAVLLRNYLVREFVNCDIYTIAQEVASIPTIEKARAAVYDREIQRRLSPHSINFLPGYADQSKCLRRTIMIKNFPSDIAPCALMELAKQRGTTFNLRMTPMSKTVARRLVDSQMKNQNVKIGKKQATDRIEAETDAKLIRDFYADINRHQNSVYYINVYVEVYGANQKELKEAEQQVAEILAGAGITYDTLRLEQRDAFESVQPLGKDMFLSDANNMPSKTAAALSPFSSSACIDAHGMALGRTEDGGPFFYDLLKRTSSITSSHFFISGATGQGKSWLMKKIIKYLAMFGVKCFIFDPEGEYHDLIRQLGGTVINRASGKWKNNIFQVRRLKAGADTETDELGYSGETPMFYQHLSWLQEQLKIIHSGLKEEDLHALMILVQDMYAEFGINADTDFSALSACDYPIYSDLYHFIEKHCGTPYKMITPDVLSRLLLYIKTCHDGAMSVLFNGHTNILNASLIDFDMRDVMEGSETCVNAVLNNDFTWAWNIVMQRDGLTFIGLDELHMFLRQPYMRRLLSSMILRARKYDGMIGTCTQQIIQCLNTEYRHDVSSILDMSPTKFLFHPGDIDSELVREALHLKNGEINYITKPNKGHCLVLSGSERYAVHVGQYPHEETLFGKGGGV